MKQSRPDGTGAGTPSHPLLGGSQACSFAASRRLGHEDRPDERNREIYGAPGGAHWGHGENYRAHLLVRGISDAETSTLSGLRAAREEIDALLRNRYDCRFLNRDHPAYHTLPPTTENLARTILHEVTEACARMNADFAACHLEESPDTGATAYASGALEREFWISFSAARQTCSPHLSPEENQAVFGGAASPLGHGHGYRFRVVLSGTWDEESGLVAPLARCRRILGETHRKLDHKHLNLEIPEWRDQPMTTECMARSLHTLLARELPVVRVVLFETPDFFAEYDGEKAALGLARSFSATHSLYNMERSEEENRRIFGRCAREGGHGHRYTVEATVTGPIDARTGTVHELSAFTGALEGVLAEFDGRRLETNLAAFRERPATCEGILQVLWNRLDPLLGPRLSRLRLRATETGRFTLRAGRSPGSP
jgi:6-pyruvoyltetrahydropterin/6-carboxytetrahydropterin synthase